MDDELKNFFTSRSKKIELHDALFEEVKIIKELFIGLTYQASTNDEFVERAKEIVKISEKGSQKLQKMYMLGGYWGTNEYLNYWSKFLSNLTDIPQGNGNTHILKMRMYPALLVMYAGLVGSVASENYKNFKSIIEAEITINRSPVILAYEVNGYLFEQSANQILETENLRLPLSEHLSENLKSIAPTNLLFDKEFDYSFDRAEALLSLVISDFNSEHNQNDWAPLGKYSNTYSRYAKNEVAIIKEEIETQGEKWKPLTAGLFGGSKERALKAVNAIERLISGRHY